MAFAQERNNSEMVDKLIRVNRVAKVVKGGRRFAFSAIVVVGDEGGRVGWGSGKAKEVPEAVRKATDAAKRAMVRVPMRDGRTIHHDMNGEFGASRVILQPATPGTGIIAGGAMRQIFEAMGIHDVVAKSLGSRNPYNMIRATFDAFERMETPRGVAAKRGLKVAELRENRQSQEMIRSASIMEKEAAKTEEQPTDKPKKAAPKKPGNKAASKPGAKAGADKPKKAEAHAKKEPQVKVESKKDALKQEAKEASAKHEKAAALTETSTAEEKKES